DDLPAEARQLGQTSFRSMSVDGRDVQFTDGFGDLHTRSYEEILAGRGFGVADARPSIELVHRIRSAPPDYPPRGTHLLFAPR
ncbi:MAG: oxidoreductase, partial [Acidobacteriota bacterium]